MTKDVFNGATLFLVIYSSIRWLSVLLQFQEVRAVIQSCMGGPL